MIREICTSRYIYVVVKQNRKIHVYNRELGTRTNLRLPGPIFGCIAGNHDPVFVTKTLQTSYSVVQTNRPDKTGSVICARSLHLLSPTIYGNRLLGLGLGLGLSKGCGARKTKKKAISMYFVLDREFISKTKLRGVVYRLPGPIQSCPARHTKPGRASVRSYRC